MSRHRRPAQSVQLGQAHDVDRVDHARKPFCEKGNTRTPSIHPATTNSSSFLFSVFFFFGLTRQLMPSHCVREDSHPVGSQLTHYQEVRKREVINRTARTNIPPQPRARRSPANRCSPRAQVVLWWGEGTWWSFSESAEAGGT